MIRSCHYIKSAKTSETAQDAIWVDTETVPTINDKGEQRHELMQGMCAYRRKSRNQKWTTPLWGKFVSAPEFWDWVEDRLHGKCRLYIFAHNWSYDAPVLQMFSELPARGWTLKSAVIQSPPIIMRWRKGPHTIQIIDTLNIWRMPLKALGKSLGLEKLTMPKIADTPEQWDIYNKRDVEIIMMACLEWWSFLRDNDLGGFASTLASQAMKTYKHKFMHQKILIEDDTSSLKLARDALHGGRCECFLIGKCPETVYKLDINSQYPAIMHKQALPARLLGHYRNVSKAELRKWLTEYCITASVRISTKQNYYPILHNKRLIFPTGEFDTVLSSPELIYALENDHIISVNSAAIYEKEILFKEYVDYFYTYRKKCEREGKTALAKMAKIMLNALYGKWAQKGIYYEKISDTSDQEIKLWIDYDGETGDTYNMRQYAGIIEQQLENTESKESHPAIAAHITAHGRHQLWGLMRGCGLGNVVYCDTDSIWTNKIGADNLAEYMDEERLGLLKIEGIHDDVVINGPKDYVIDGNEKIKGIRKKAVKIRDGVYEQDKFTTLVGLLRRGDLSAPIVSTVRKHLSRIYTKGVVDERGNVTPYLLNL